MFHAKALDPVCGMKVDSRKAQFTAQHGRKTHHFCGPACKAAFEAEPSKYAAGGKRGCHCC
jgi:Cu+-exporting ATPase